MARKTAMDKLSEAIAGILEEYSGDVAENVGAIAVEMGKRGAQALRNNSREALNKGSGEYAKGWTYQADRGRMNTTVTIFNNHPSLPHLLEFGHVTRNGTSRVFPRTPAHEHIAPVEAELVEAFEREVVAKL